MSYPSHTTINVASLEQGRHVHFFRVEIDRPPQFCMAQIMALQKRFPAKDGFEVTVTYWECKGTTVDPRDYIAQPEQGV